MITKHIFHSLALAGLFHSLAFIPELSAETPQLVPFHQWHNPLLGDYFSTTDPIWSPSRGTQVGDYTYQRTEGRIFSPLAPAPADTVPLYHWFSAARGDNFTTANPAWVPNGGIRGGDYIFIRTQGFVFNKPLAGTVPLHSWYNATVGDNFATGDPSWIGQTGVTREGYGYYRTEGWMYPSATNEPPHNSRAFGHGTMEILGKQAIGRRPLVVIMNKLTPQPFYSPHTADYYRRLIHGPGDRTIAGYFTADSSGKFTWSDGGMAWLEVPYPGGDASPYHTRLFQSAAAAGIDFSRFDSNGDGVVTADELAVLVIHADPPGDNCGNTAFIVPILEPVMNF